MVDIEGKGDRDFAQFDWVIVDEIDSGCWASPGRGSQAVGTQASTIVTPPSSSTRHPLQYSHERARSRYFLTQFRAFPIVAALVRARAFWPSPVREVRRYLDGTLPVPGSPHTVFTPGHTLGHCALHFPDRDAVIAGDAVVTLDPYTAERGAEDRRRGGHGRQRAQPRLARRPGRDRRRQGPHRARRGMEGWGGRGGCAGAPGQALLRRGRTRTRARPQVAVGLRR